MKITSCAITDIGQKRKENQDHFLLNEEMTLFVVADGMGGHLGGEVASQLAVTTIEEVMSQVHVETDTVDILTYAIRLASKRVWDEGRKDPDLQGMGTTTVAMLFEGNRVFLANVGDSRAYRIRAGVIDQMTDDHSVVAEQVRMGILTPEAAKKSNIRNWITRSVGHEEEVQVDRFVCPVEKGDRYLLCSDGLTNTVEPAEILEIAGTGSPDDAARALVDLANQRGGDDNVTIVIARVDALDPRGKRKTFRPDETTDLHWPAEESTPMPDE